MRRLVFPSSGSVEIRWDSDDGGAVLTLDTFDERHDFAKLTTADRHRHWILPKGTADRFREWDAIARVAGVISLAEALATLGEPVGE